jgi:hypothetical protein
MHGGCEPWDAEPSRTLAPLLPRRSHARILVVQAGLTALPQIRMLRRRTTHVGVGSLMTGSWFGNLKFLLILISPYCQARSDKLSLTCLASIETVLAPTLGEPWWSRGDRRSHCEPGRCACHAPAFAADGKVEHRRLLVAAVAPCGGPSASCGSGRMAWAGALMFGERHEPGISAAPFAEGQCRHAGRSARSPCASAHPNALSPHHSCWVTWFAG